MYEYRWAKDENAETGKHNQAAGTKRRMGLFLDVVRELKSRPMQLRSIKELAQSLDAVQGSVATVVKRILDDNPDLGIELVNRSVVRYNPARDRSVDYGAKVTEQDIADWHEQDEEVPVAQRPGPARVMAATSGQREHVPTRIGGQEAHACGRGRVASRSARCRSRLCHAGMAAPELLEAARREQEVLESIAAGQAVPLTNLHEYHTPGDMFHLECVYDVGEGKYLVKGGHGKLYELRPLS